MIFGFGVRMLSLLGLDEKLAKRFGWVPAIVLAGLLVMLVMRIAAGWFSDALDTAEEAGATKAVVAGQQTTIGQVKDAKNAADEIRNDVGFARYCQCLQDAAAGYAGSCQRELVNKPVPHDEQVALAACADLGKR